MARILASNVRVKGEGGQHVVLQAGSELPEWAQDQVTNDAVFLDSLTTEAVLPEAEPGIGRGEEPEALAPLPDQSASDPDEAVLPDAEPGVGRDGETEEQPVPPQDDSTPDEAVLPAAEPAEGRDDTPAADYDDMKVAELRALIADRNEGRDAADRIPTSGTKADLVAALTADDA